MQTHNERKSLEIFILALGIKSIYKYKRSVIRKNKRSSGAPVGLLLVVSLGAGVLLFWPPFSEKLMKSLFNKLRLKMTTNNVVIVHVHKQVYLLIGRHFSCSDNFSLSIQLHVVAQVKSSSQLNQSFAQLSRSGAASTIGATMITELAILVLYVEINSMNLS